MVPITKRPERNQLRAYVVAEEELRRRFMGLSGEGKRITPACCGRDAGEKHRNGHSGYTDAINGGGCLGWRGNGKHA
jgi:hypothetical protein